MAYYLLGSSGGSCCPTCPPPDTCGCFQDCGTCVPDTTFYDSDCAAVTDDLGNPVDISFSACEPATSEWTNWETNHPGGSGWTTLYVCEACPCTDGGTSTPTLVFDLLPENASGVYVVDFIALTTHSLAQVEVFTRDCSCFDVTGAEVSQGTITSSDGVSGSLGPFLVERQTGTPSCPSSMRVVCDDIPPDCCGWKLSWRRVDGNANNDCACDCGPNSGTGTLDGSSHSSGIYEVHNTTTGAGTYVRISACGGVTITQAQYDAMAAAAGAASFNVSFEVFGDFDQVVCSEVVNGPGAYLCNIPLPSWYRACDLAANLVINIYFDTSAIADAAGGVAYCYAYAEEQVNCGTCNGSYVDGDLSSFSGFNCVNASNDNCTNRTRAAEFTAFTCSLT